MIKSVYLRGEIVQRRCKSDHRKAVCKYGVVDGGSDWFTFVHWFNPNSEKFTCSRIHTHALAIALDEDKLPIEVINKSEEIMAKTPLKQGRPRTKFYRQEGH